MKIISLKILLMMTICLFVGQTADAQKGNGNKNNIDKKQISKFLSKTSNILFITSNKIRRNKIYSGYFYKAKENQRKAMNFFNEEKFDESVIYSYTARKYAFLAFEINKGKIPDRWKTDKNEEVLINKLFPTGISDDELKNQVDDDDKKAEEEDFNKKGGKKNG